VFCKVFTVQPLAWGLAVCKRVFLSHPSSALPIVCHFVLELWLLSSEREIPLSSVWMHCFQTLQALCCCVSHPMRASFRRGALTSWPVIGWPRGAGPAGRQGCSAQQQSLDCLCFIIWR
jgi:hypothetical protein